MSTADEERAALRRVAETEREEVAAVAACLLGHAEVRNGMQWKCACNYEPRLGEMHARHVGVEVLALLGRRSGARRAAAPS